MNYQYKAYLTELWISPTKAYLLSLDKSLGLLSRTTLSSPEEEFLNIEDGATRSVQVSELKDF